MIWDRTADVSLFSVHPERFASLLWEKERKFRVIKVSLWPPSNKRGDGQRPEESQMSTRYCSTRQRLSGYISNELSLISHLILLGRRWRVNVKSKSTFLLHFPGLIFCWEQFISACYFYVKTVCLHNLDYHLGCIKFSIKQIKI